MVWYEAHHSIGQNPEPSPPETVVSGELPNVAADQLVSLYLVRTEETRGGIWYELAHDRFIDPVLRSNEAHPPEASSLTGDAKAWQDGARDVSFLYRGQRLKKAEETTEDSSLALTKLEEKFFRNHAEPETRRRARQTQRLRLLSAGLCILACSDWTFLCRLQREPPLPLP